LYKESAGLVFILNGLHEIHYRKTLTGTNEEEVFVGRGAWREVASSTEQRSGSASAPLRKQVGRAGGGEIWDPVDLEQRGWERTEEMARLTRG
jgi:hypothetical protein